MHYAYIIIYCNNITLCKTGKTTVIKRTSVREIISLLAIIG